MIKIRLMRIGAKKKPFYRVVVVDERAKRTGAYIELLGTYNPLTEPKEIKLKQDRIDHWIKQGAQPSTGYLRIIGKAPQRLPRKPKKEKKTTEPSAVSDQISEEKVQEEKSAVNAGEDVKA
ncbi:30S ribosomal protein S16, partial [Candidatus Daviesbacteria bacterium RIFCSPLOWO2_02_FULL_41_8]